jgi:hypothetical protein
VHGVAAKVVVDPQDHAGVLRAVGDLEQDIERVTGVRPARASATAPPGLAVVVGTLDKSSLIDRLIRQGKLDVREIRGRWEASLIQVVERPWPGADRALVVVGSDKRGTTGIYDVSEEIGVSPGTAGRRPSGTARRPRRRGLSCARTEGQVPGSSSTTRRRR